MEKFYWLKLKRDFFKRHDIRIIEDMQNGKDYILFYLKLLCESVDHEGNLRFSEQLPYDEKMLSVITNTNIDVVRSAITIFTKLGMMEILDDGTYFMNEVNKMIGSAVDNDNANRQRRFRERQKALLNEPQNNTTLQDCYDSVTKNNESKNKSKSIEKDIDNNNIEQKFATFWSVYPKKVGKDKCLRWFKTHKVDDELLNKMLDTISKFKNSTQWTKENGQYIPHPYTWLNRGGWEDELKEDNFTSSNNIETVWEEL